MQLLLAALLFLQGIGTRPPTPTGAISGQILTMDGNPATKVFVGAIRIDDPPPGPYSPLLASTETDADGKYRLKAMPAGKYRVMAGILDFATYFPGVPEPGEANTVVLTGTADLDNINFPMIASDTLEIDGRTITEIVKKIELRYPGREANTRIVTALRTRLNLRYITQSANAIMIRDTPSRIAFGERLVRDFDKSAVTGQTMGSLSAGPEMSDDPLVSGVGFDASRNVYLLEPNALHDMNPARSQLRPSGPVLLKTKADTRMAFETVADKADLNVIFDPRVEAGSAKDFEFDSADVRDAFDLLAKRTSTYWQALDSRTILVAPDSPAAHQSMDQQVFRTFYLSNGSTVQLTEIVTTLRTLLNLRSIATAPALLAISMRDTPGMIALSEKIIGDLDQSNGQGTATAAPRTPLPPSAAVTLDAFGNLMKADDSGGQNVTPGRAELQLKTAGPVSLDMKTDGRSAFQTVADLAGIAVHFDPAFETGPRVAIHVKNGDIFGIFDRLALQTQSFWQIADGHTITVVPNTPANRQNLPRIQSTINLAHTQEEAPMTAILNALRILLNAKDSELNVPAHAIVMTDTPNNLTLARKIVEDLDRPAR